MARTYGSYSVAVPLNDTWEESFIIEDRDGNPVDISDLHVRCQLRAVHPVLLAGVPLTDPVLELTTEGFYTTPPAWPIAEAFSIPTGTDGMIKLLALPADFSPYVSPFNEQVTYLWQIKLTDKPVTDTQPVVQGKVKFRRALTV